jgi:hypothetical protein
MSAELNKLNVIPQKPREGEYVALTSPGPIAKTMCCDEGLD